MKHLALAFFILLYACSPLLPIDNPFEKPLQATSPSNNPPEESLLRIVALNVGQGDATLILSPSGKNLLIDVGPPTSGVLKILPVLEELDVHHLDWILLSHFDQDHLGGLFEILEGADHQRETEDDLIPISGIIDRGDNTSKQSEIYLNYLHGNLPNRIEAKPGMKLNLGSEIQATVVVANGHLLNGSTVHLNPDEENEASIGILIEYKGFRYFTAGDLPGGGNPGGYETKDLESLVGKVIGDIDVLHVSHHGSASSTHPDYLKDILPEAAIISAGDNDYGHPTPEVLRNLESIGAQVYRTDTMGTIVIETDGKEYRIDDFLQTSSKNVFQGMNSTCSF